MKIVQLGLVCIFLAAVTACTTMSSSPDKDRLIRLGHGIIEDTKTGLQWQLDKSPQMFSTQEKAREYAASLNLGGHQDWRLPTLEERWELLQVFVLKNNGGIEFPHDDSKYWTSGTDKGTRPIKLGITCMCRGDQEIEYKQEGYVRAVRGPAVRGQ